MLSPIKTGERVTGAIEILEDVTERHIAEENLRYYTGQITRVQEEERKYIARELHDGTVQTLVALIYQLDNFMRGSPALSEEDTERLKAMHKSLKLEYMREIVRDSITDSGEGFDLPDKIGSLPRGGKLGLAGIEERVQLLGGSLQIQSTRGRVTTIRVELPTQGYVEPVGILPPARRSASPTKVFS